MAKHSVGQGLMSTRVLVIAAGNAARWKDHEGVPKHLVEIEGEILVHRTARQFIERSCSVVIVGLDERYAYPGAELYIPRDDERLIELDKLRVANHLWGNEKTLLVFGDVYFTDEAVDTIVSDKSDLRFYLRKAGSNTTGKLSKEMFAIGFTSENEEKFVACVEKLVKDGRIDAAGGWAVFRYLVTGSPVHAWNDNSLFKNEHLYVNIDDWTEDFDYPLDLDRWRENRENWLKTKK